MNLLRKKDGVALITVMMVLLVLTIMLGGLVILTNSNLNQSETTKDHTAAYYTAESGLTKTVTDFENYIENLSTQSPALSVSAFVSTIETYVSNHANEQLTLTANQGDTPYADVTLVSDGIQADGFNQYTITSTGYLGDLSRTLVKIYKFKYQLNDDGSGFIVDKAVMVQNDFTLTGSSQVIGAPISTYSKADDAINLTWSTKVPAIELDASLFDSSGNLIDTGIFENLQNMNSKITEGGLNAVTALDEVFEYPPITMPTYPNPSTLSRLPAYTIQNSYKLVDSSGNLTKNSYMTNNFTYSIPSTSDWYYVPQLIIKGQETFTINVGDTDKFLVVDKLQLDGYFVIVGSGTLTIYVRGNTVATATNDESDRISFNYTSNLSVGSIGSPSKFVVYVDPIYQKSGNTVGPLTVRIGGSGTYYMALMAANLNINVNGSGKIYGYIVTGGDTINITGGSSATITLYYAPNALVTISGSGQVNGAIVCESFLGTGNIRVNYSDVSFENFPFEVLDPITGGSGSSDPTLEIQSGQTIEQ